MYMNLKRYSRGLLAGGLLLALIAAPGFADVTQVKLGLKGAT
jgi:hypothetical protein